jgi:hypothetical protein
VSKLDDSQNWMYPFEVELGKLPQEPQAQDSLDNQLQAMYRIANKCGLYDAADWLKKKLDKPLEKR